MIPQTEVWVNSYTSNYKERVISLGNMQQLKNGIVTIAIATVQSNYNFTLSRVITRGYMERAAVSRAMWLRVPRPHPTLSHVSMRGN